MMTDPKNASLHHHILAVKKGDRVYENAFQSVSRMILEKEINKVTVNGKKLKSRKLTPALLESMDLVVITTDHSDYDYDMIVKHAKHVVDTRNATKKVREGREKIRKA